MEMPLFGWSRNSSEESLTDSSTARRRSAPRPKETSEDVPPDTTTTPVALPPPDPTVSELEALLAQAKVGTHEFAYISSHPQDQSRTAVVNETVPPEPKDNTSLVPPDDNLPIDLSPEQIEASYNLAALSSEIAPAPTPEENRYVSSVLDSANVEPSTIHASDLALNHSGQDTGAGTTTDVGNKTHTSLSIFRAPQLRFFTEEKTIPVQLHSFQQQSCRRRHQFQKRLHDLECKVAELTAKVAEENMDLDLDLRNALATKVYAPIEAALESVCLHRYDNAPSSSGGTDSLAQRWMMLERRLSTLDSQMTHSIHVQLEDLKRDDLNSWRQKLTQEVIPETKEDGIAADRMETAFARRWESQAGIMARRFAEERATRVAALLGANTKLDDLDPCRGKELMSQIQVLREKLQQERAERIEHDERVQRHILDTFHLLEEAILEAHPDPDKFDTLE